MINNTIIYSSNFHNFVFMEMHFCEIPIMVLCILCNAINFIVFCQKELRKTQYAFYFACLSFSNIFQVYMVLAQHLQRYGIYIELLSGFMCKLHSYLMYTIPWFPTWLTVLISFIRCFCMVSQRFYIFHNKKFVKAFITVFVTIICLIANIGFFFFMDLFVTTQDNVTKYECNAKSEFKGFYDQFIFYICPILDSIVPFVIMSVFYLVSVTEACNEEKHNYISELTENDAFGAEKTILGLNLFFFVSHLPTCILTLINTESIVRNYSFLYFVFFSFLCFQYTHSIFLLFIFYFVNRLFRKEIWKLFFNIFYCFRHQ